ncbi:MAG: hypothetical protein Q9227_006686 [Pyrenula ochraceoflavens]
MATLTGPLVIWVTVETTWSFEKHAPAASNELTNECFVPFFEDNFDPSLSGSIAVSANSVSRQAQKRKRDFPSLSEHFFEPTKVKKRDERPAFLSEDQALVRSARREPTKDERNHLEALLRDNSKDLVWEWLKLLDEGLHPVLARDMKLLRILAFRYRQLRPQIWSVLAVQTGRLWEDVEKECMGQGLQNLKALAEEFWPFREPESDYEPIQNPYWSDNTFDSGFGEKLPHCASSSIFIDDSSFGEVTEDIASGINEWQQAVCPQRSWNNQRSLEAMVQTDQSESTSERPPEVVLERSISNLDTCTTSRQRNLSETDSTSEWSPLSPESFEMEGEVYENFVQEVLARFCSELEAFQNEKLRSCAGPKRSSSQAFAGISVAGSTPLPASEENSQLSKSRKGLNNQDEDEDRDGTQKRRLGSKLVKAQIEKLLACPFYKFNPMRYSEINQSEKGYRCCSSKYLPDINRLKSHLYRVHSKPAYYCGRCYAEFNTQEDLDEHTRLTTGCELCDSPKYTERMTTEQRNRVRRRAHGKSAEENWYDIFKILFPGAGLPDSPYLETDHSRTILNFLSFFRREAPAILQSNLRTEFAEQSQQIFDEHGQIMLRRAIDQCIDQIIGSSSQDSDVATNIEPIAPNVSLPLPPSSRLPLTPGPSIERPESFPTTDATETGSDPSPRNGLTTPPSQDTIKKHSSYDDPAGLEGPRSEHSSDIEVSLGYDLGPRYQFGQQQQQYSMSNLGADSFVHNGHTSLFWGFPADGSLDFEFGDNVFDWSGTHE